MTLNRHILIVDDQDDLRGEIARMLRKPKSSAQASSLIQQIRSRISKERGPAPKSEPVTYQVDTAGQGKDAYELVRNSFASHEPYALMFLDMRMPPGWDGLQTAQRIRAIDKEIQIVIMTAYADYDQTEIAEQIGEPDKLLYIKKPFHPEEIRQLALAMTEKWNMNRREKEHLILTNRLMRENAYLTRRGSKGLGGSYRAILNAFVSFLEAHAGILARTGNGKPEICAATSPRDAEQLLAKASKEAAKAERLTTNDDDGSCIFPLRFDKFSGYLYLDGKGIVFPYDQLQPFLDILGETAREVLLNAFLAREYGEAKTISAVGAAAAKFADRIRASLVPVGEDTAKLAKAADGAERTQLCQRISAANDMLLSLAEDISQFSGSVQAELKCTEQKLAAIVARVVKELASEAGEASVQITQEIPADLILSCDGEALHSCFGQLAKNAIEALASAPEPRQLQISASLDETGAGSVVITIQDNAGGLPSAVGEQLFAPFVSHGKDAASGLGAAIAKQVVERHCGKITVKSEDGEGTTFTISLPLAPPE